MEQDSQLEIDNLPNRLTLFRIILIPVIIGLLLFSHPKWSLDSGQTVLLGWIAGWIFALASITDFLDGHIARTRKLTTLIGSFLDPIADKFLIVSALIMLGYLERLPILVVIALVLRELYMTSLRLLVAGQGLEIPVNQWGKWKTATQMIGVPFLMAYDRWWIFPLPLMGIILIYLSCGLSLFSAGLYSWNVVTKIRQHRRNRKANKVKNNYES